MALRLSEASTTAAILATALWWSNPVSAAPVKTAEAACNMVKVRVSAHRHFPVSAVAFCDPINEADGPKGYYVLGLHGHCHQDVCGSTLMGWFAVEKNTGRVFDFDVADFKVGEPIKRRR